MSASLVWLKLGLALVIFLEGLMGGALPYLKYFLHRVFIHHQNFMPYLNSFGGGVIFAVGLIHLFNEGTPKIEAWCGGDCSVAYPSLTLVTCYLLMLLCFHVLPHRHHHKEESAPLLERNGTEVDMSKEAAGLLTFASLSIHGVWTTQVVLGLAIGLDTDSTAVVNTAIGVLAHKWADTLTLSLVLLKSRTKYVSLLCMLPLQALACPLGIFVGMAASSNLSDVVLGFSLCATAGFLTYFFASEIVPELFNGENSGTKFVLTCAGIALFTVAVSLGDYYSGD